MLFDVRKETQNHPLKIDKSLIVPTVQDDFFYEGPQAFDEVQIRRVRGIKIGSAPGEDFQASISIGPGVISHHEDTLESFETTFGIQKWEGPVFEATILQLLQPEPPGPVFRPITPFLKEFEGMRLYYPFHANLHHFGNIYFEPY